MLCIQGRYKSVTPHLIVARSGGNDVLLSVRYDSSSWDGDMKGTYIDKHDLYRFCKEFVRLIDKEGKKE